MKAEINLLPTEIKDARIRMIKHRRIGMILGSVIVGLLIVVMSLGFVWWTNNLLRAALNDRLSSQNKDRADIEQHIKALNGQLATMNQRITAHPRWAIHMQDVLRAVPKGIVITKFELTENPSTLQITGKAASGALVVTYQNALQALPWVDYVDAPLQNFARSPEATVTFTIVRKADNGGSL